MDHWAGADAVQQLGHRRLGLVRGLMAGVHYGADTEVQLVDGAEIPLDAADGQPACFPQGGDETDCDETDCVAAETLPTHDHAVQFRLGQPALLTHWAGSGDLDVLGNLRRNQGQLDDFAGALGPATGQLGSAIGAVLHHTLHPMGGRQARAGETVTPLLAGFLLRRWLPARFRLEARHSGRAARFDLTFQLGNTPLAPLNHPPLLQNGGRQLGDDRDENIVVGGGQVNLGIHSPYMT